MRLIETSQTFPLSSVKPLEELAIYRKTCIDLTKKFLAQGSRPREISPSSGQKLEVLGEVEGLPYGRDLHDGGLFLMELPKEALWGKFLTEVMQIRHSPQGFHRHLAQSRMDHVYAPKLEWVEETLRLQQICQPKILEAATFPSDFTQLLRESGSFSEVLAEDETALAVSGQPAGSGSIQAAILLESLDRSINPQGLLAALRARMEKGGLLFVTALVASGFDFQVLGLRNLYLVPPDRTNCFTLEGLLRLLEQHGFSPIEVSTPGVLDLEVVRAHGYKDPMLPLSSFERRILESDEATRGAFQSFLQQRGLSSFARIVARKER